MAATSSKTINPTLRAGLILNIMRAGYLGLLAAWVAFTLPSAIILVAFAHGAGALEAAAGTGWIHGLKAAAVAVVAHAVLGMARSLAPDKERATIAVAGMIGAMLMPFAIVQVLVILSGGLIGLVWLRSTIKPAEESEMMAVPVRRRTALLSLFVFFVLLVLLPVFATATGDGTLRLMDGFYRAGSMVFGGGHVVLPLLQAEVVDTGLVDRDAFLAGYGAAQRCLVHSSPSLPTWARWREHLPRELPGRASRSLPFSSRPLCSSSVGCHSGTTCAVHRSRSVRLPA